MDYLFFAWDAIKNKEETSQIKPDYLNNHLSLNQSMRFLLLEWMCDVFLFEFRLLVIWGFKDKLFIWLLIMSIDFFRLKCNSMTMFNG